MDALLSSFVKQYIDKLNLSELKDLDQFLIIEDEVLYNFYFRKNYSKSLASNKMLTLFKNFVF